MLHSKTSFVSQLFIIQTIFLQNTSIYTYIKNTKMVDSSVSPWKAVGQTDIETKRSRSSKDYQRCMTESFIFRKKSNMIHIEKEPGEEKR